MVASLAESSYVEGNASCNWQTGGNHTRGGGQVVDVQERWMHSLAAPAETSVELVTVLVLPSITSAHF